MSHGAGRLLGFDIRIQPEDYSPTIWSPRRREIYLLNPNLERPFSVDSSVWPSLFRYPTLISDGVPPHPLTTIEVERGYTDHELWLDMFRMRSCCGETAANNSRRGVEIAIVLFADADLTSYQFGSSILEKETVPPRLADEALFLGYDIADAGLLSGLNNCSYSAEERLTLGQAWSGNLNEHSLFTSLEAAREYRTITDERVAEHAPFWVFGLYQLPRDRAGGPG